MIKYISGIVSMAIFSFHILVEPIENGFELSFYLMFISIQACLFEIIEKKK